MNLHDIKSKYPNLKGVFCTLAKKKFTWVGSVNTIFCLAQFTHQNKCQNTKKSKEGAKLQASKPKRIKNTTWLDNGSKGHNI